MQAPKGGSVVGHGARQGRKEKGRRQDQQDPRQVQFVTPRITSCNRRLTSCDTAARCTSMTAPWFMLKQWQLQLTPTIRAVVIVTAHTWGVGW